MKHLECFNGSVTSALHGMGLDSVKVLDAVNAFIGGIKADPEKTKVTAGAKLTGKETEKKDKRIITIRESEKRSAVMEYGPIPALYALNTAMEELTDRHGITVEITSLPPIIAAWANRDSFRSKVRHAPSETMAEAVPVHPGA